MLLKEQPSLLVLKVLVFSVFDMDCVHGGWYKGSKRVRLGLKSQQKLKRTATHHLLHAEMFWFDPYKMYFLYSLSFIVCSAIS